GDDGQVRPMLDLVPQGPEGVDEVGVREAEELARRVPRGRPRASGALQEVDLALVRVVHVLRSRGGGHAWLNERPATRASNSKNRSSSSSLFSPRENENHRVGPSSLKRSRISRATPHSTSTRPRAPTTRAPPVCTTPTIRTPRGRTTTMRGSPAKRSI